MVDSRYWNRYWRRRISRRALLGAGAVTAIGAASAAIIGCNGGDSGSPVVRPLGLDDGDSYVPERTDFAVWVCPVAVGFAPMPVRRKRRVVYYHRRAPQSTAV